MDVRLLAATLAAAACLIVPAPALGAEGEQLPGSTLGAPERPEFLPETPEDFQVSAREAITIANGDPKVAEQTERYGRLTTAIEVNDDGLWQVGYKSGDNEVAQVRSTAIPGRSSRRGPATRSRGRWPAATRASSAIC